MAQQIKRNIRYNAFLIVFQSAASEVISWWRCGVAQGYVLGPLLFISYIYDVSRIIRYSHFHIYVDDLQIYHTYAASDFQRCRY
jgi:hypothetical protein